MFAWANRLMQTLGRARRARRRGKSAVTPVVFLHGIGGGARIVRAADRELRGGRLSAGRARPAGLRRARAGRGDELRGAGRGCRVHDRAERRSSGRCWSAIRWAAWWCRPCCAAGRTTIAPRCSPARRRPSAIRPAISRRNSSRIASRRSMPGAPWPTSRPSAADSMMGPNADPAGRALFIEALCGGAGSDLSGGGAMPRHLRRARQPARHHACRCSASRPSTTAMRRRRWWRRWRRKSPARTMSACPASATCRTSRHRRLSTRRSSTSSTHALAAKR